MIEIRRQIIVQRRLKSRRSRVMDVFYHMIAGPLEAGANIRWGRVLDYALIFLAVASVVLLLADLLVLTPRQAALEDEYDAVLGFDARRAIVIDHRTGETRLEDVQVEVILDTAAMIDAGRLRPDGADLRFTDSDGATLLPFWLETGLGTNNTRYWVRVPVIPAGGRKTIYCYYDQNTTAVEPLSNGSATFAFFDDFERATLGERWGVVGNGPQRGIFDGELRVDGYDPGRLSGYATRDAFPTGSGLVVEARLRYGRPPSGNGTIVVVGCSNILPYTGDGFTLPDLYGGGLAGDTGAVVFTSVFNGTEQHGPVPARAGANDTDTVAQIQVSFSRDAAKTLVKARSVVAGDASSSTNASFRTIGMATMTPTGNLHCYLVSDVGSGARVDWVAIRTPTDNVSTMLLAEDPDWFQAGVAVGELIMTFIYIDLIICEIFFIEFFTKALASKDPKRYVKQHWNDILGMLPVSHPILRPVSWLRLVRLFIVISRVKVGVDKAYGQGATRRFIRRYKEVLADEITGLVMMKVLEMAEAELEKEKYRTMLADMTKTIEARRDEVKEMALGMIDRSMDRMTITRLIKQVPFVNDQIKKGVDSSIDSVMDMLASEEVNEMVMGIIKQVLQQAKSNFAVKALRPAALPAVLTNKLRGTGSGPALDTEEAPDRASVPADLADDRDDR